jgi:hypothetical protein
MIASDEFGRIWKEAFIVCSNVISHHLHRGTSEILKRTSFRTASSAEN